MKLLKRELRFVVIVVNINLSRKAARLYFQKFVTFTVVKGIKMF